jgi:hypothetical protein
MASGKGGDPSRFAKSNFPTWGSPKRLADGDWIRFGISGAVDGYMFDLARAKAVGPVTNRQIELFESAIDCIEATLAAIRPGVTAGELGAAGLDKQQSLGFRVDGVFSAMGHGLGLGWDDPWLARGVAAEIVPNMVLCIERTIQQAATGALVLVDGDLRPDPRLPVAWVTELLAAATARGITVVGVTKHTSMSRGGAPLIGQLEAEAVVTVGHRARWWARIGHSPPATGVPAQL